MNLIMPDSGLIFWMTLIFGLVFFILAKFGFPIITGMVDKRTKRIDEAIEAARKAEEALSNLTQEQEKLISEAKEEQARILHEATVQRDKLIAQAQEEARMEAAKIMTEASQRIQEEKNAAIREVQKEVAVLSVAIAEKLVRKELSTDKGQKQLIDSLFEEVSESRIASEN